MTVRTTERPSLELAGEYPGVVSVSVWKNLGICSWTGGAVGPAVDTVASAMDKLHATAARTSWVHLIQDGLPLPDSAARSGFIRIMKERTTELACVAIVVGGTGFWASAMRNAVIGLRVFAPRSFDFRLHGTHEEVVRWLPEAHREKTGVQISPESLARLLSQVRPA
ncbi:MAG TPA: hypothetical protein VJR89_30350 [Polyangiales bacterium]|nr:hypothetical protein [Polyangiales bacterium]